MGVFKAVNDFLTLTVWTNILILFGWRSASTELLTLGVFCWCCCCDSLCWLFSRQSCRRDSSVCCQQWRREKFHLREKNSSFKPVCGNSHQHILVLHFPRPSRLLPFCFLTCPFPFPLFLFIYFLFLSFLSIPFSFPISFPFIYLLSFAFIFPFISFPFIFPLLPLSFLFRPFPFYFFPFLWLNLSFSSHLISLPFLSRLQLLIIAFY